MSAQYVTLAPVTYLDGSVVREVTKAGVIITLDATQATALAGSVSYVSSSTPFVDEPRVVALSYDTFALFPTLGSEQRVYLDESTGKFYRWSDLTLAYIAVSTGAPDVAVVDGGTGVSTLTGIVKGNGTAPFTASATVAVVDGGTGAATLTGIVKGNGTSPFTAAVSNTDYLAPSGSAVVTNKDLSSSTNSLTVRNPDFPNGISNGNSARQSQVTSTNTSYYITSSGLAIPATMKLGMAVGTRFVWTVAMDKTAAGTGTFSIVIFRGTNGTTADTADVTQSIGTQTAAVDNMMVDVEVTVTATGATGSYYWAIIPNNAAASATGFGVTTGTGAYLSGTVSSVAMNTASLIFGLGFRNGATGTPTITVPMVKAQAINIS